ncbi:thermonuclease family protein [Priestia megaterium]
MVQKHLLTQKRLEGQEITLEFDVQERDQYGRLLAYVWIDNELYNEELLAKG